MDRDTSNFFIITLIIVIFYCNNNDTYIEQTLILKYELIANINFEVWNLLRCKSKSESIKFAEVRFLRPVVAISAWENARSIDPLIPCKPGFSELLFLKKRYLIYLKIVIFEKILL
jgi:hypothetical protein